MIIRFPALALALACTAMIVHGAQAESQRVGVTSAVNPTAAGTPPGAATRQLVIGSEVVFRERVITTAEGQAQLLFLDQSSLMIGPNSTVVIDEFVYDPNTSIGNFAATLTQGSFRYIGGRLSKQGKATLRTPVATIGIRGSDVTVIYDAARTFMDVLATHGTATVETLGGVLGLRTGFGTIVRAPEAPPAPARSLTAAEIAAANAQFEGQPGKTAGAATPPSDDDVADSGLDDLIEARRLAAIEPAAGGGAGGTGTPPVTTQQLASALDQASMAASEGAQQQASTTTAATVNAPPPGSPPPGNPPPGNPPPPAGPRTAQALNGYVAGFAVTQSGSSARQYAVTNETPTDVEIRTVPDPDGIGRVYARFGYHNTAGAQVDTAVIELGDAPGSAPATQSVFIDDATFMAAQNALASAQKAQVNGVDADVNAVMVSIPGSTVFGQLDGQISNGSLCDCEYTTWGLWAASLEASGTRQIVPLGLWVAGRLPDITDPSPQGSATFSGRAVGMVQNQGQQYFKSGEFTNNYNFTKRSGLVSIQNFDGRSVSGTVSPVGSDWRSYSGTLTGGNLTGSVNGAFYGNAAGQQMPAETGGNFNFGGGNYNASGVFIGKR